MAIFCLFTDAIRTVATPSGARTCAPSLGWSGLETDGVTGKDRPASTRRPAGPAPETLHMQANGNFMPPPARGALRTTLAWVYADLTPLSCSRRCYCTVLVEIT